MNNLLGTGDIVLVIVTHYDTFPINPFTQMMLPKSRRVRSNCMVGLRAGQQALLVKLGQMVKKLKRRRIPVVVVAMMAIIRMMMKMISVRVGWN